MTPSDPISSEDGLLLSEKVKKKSKFIFFSDRILKLFSNGELRYYRVKSNELKDVIPLNKILLVNLEGKHKSKIVTSQKTYIFRHSSEEKATEWVSKIKELMRLQAPPPSKSMAHPGRLSKSKSSMSVLVGH